MKPSSTTTSGKATDMIAGICTIPRLPCPCTKRHVMLNPTSTGVCNTGTSALYVCDLLLWLTWWWMLLYITLIKVTSTNMRKKTCKSWLQDVLLLLLSFLLCVVLRRPTPKYKHPYSMMHRRLPTAGIEVVPHYHQLLVDPPFPTHILCPVARNSLPDSPGNVWSFNPPHPKYVHLYGMMS